MHANATKLTELLNTEIYPNLDGYETNVPSEEIELDTAYYPSTVDLYRDGETEFSINLSLLITSSEMIMEEFEDEDEDDDSEYLDVRDRIDKSEYSFYEREYSVSISIDLNTKNFHFEPEQTGYSILDDMLSELSHKIEYHPDIESIILDDIISNFDNTKKYLRDKTIDSLLS